MDAASATDNCGEVTIDVVEATTAGACAGDYTITRTFTATDDCGNATSATQTITIVDTTAPEFTFVPSDFTAECTDNTSMGDAIATDNCGAVTINVVESTTPGDCAGDYTITRTFTATDDCGNVTSATQTVTFFDNTAPVLTIPADYTAECSDAHPMDDATATDACSSVTIELFEWTTPGNAVGNYVVTRTFTATDACGNYTTGTQTITIVDTTAPVLSIPADYSMECGITMILDDAVASDNCGDVSIIITTNTIIGSCAFNYQLVRTFTASDDAGNAVSASQTITVEDTTAPVFTYTPDVTVTLNEADGDVMPEAFVLVWDACDLSPTWSYSDVVTDVTGATTTTVRTYTVVDDCGNSATFVQTIIFTSVIEGCMDPTACNYNIEANQDDGTCSYPQFAYDCNGDCLNDVNENGICDELEILGCTDPTNPGYNPAANVDDGSCLVGGCIISYACNYDTTADYQLTGSCEFTSCAGCTDVAACNYDPTATLNDGSCSYPDYGYDCFGVCVNDADLDGICDEFEVPGCTDPSNPGFNPNATDDDGSCLVGGCVLPFACNYDASADYLVITDCDFSTCVGCMDVTACNYDASATINSPSSCSYPVNQFVDCFGECNNDTDNDGVCDELEIAGCTDPAANNYNPNATDDDGSCIILTGGCTLPFACNYDPTADYYLPGSCDFSCLFGMPASGAVCTDPLACNFGEAGVCEYFDEFGVLCATLGCMDEAACNYDPAAQIAGSCDYTSCLVYGCTNVNACNYDALATTNNGTCEYTSCLGCTDTTANNYDPTATVDDNSCTYDVYGCMILTACNYNPDATVSDDSCDFVTCFGCATPAACNYDVNVIYPDGSCVFADAGYDCDGNCLADADGDGVCDANEIVGCTDSEASNYNPDATDDSGSCQYPSSGCTDQTACNFDFTAVADDGSCEYTSCSGCIAPSACNYDPAATLSDGTCIFPDIDGNCGPVCDSDVDGDGICDADEIAGCSYSTASNYSATATDDDGSCMFFGCTNGDYSNYNAFANNDDSNCSNTPLSADFNGDGIVQLEDLLEFLIAFGQSGPNWSIDWVDAACGVVGVPFGDLIDATAPGCTYPTAANYDPAATMDAGNCVFPGCTDSTALNFNPLSNLEDSSCTYQVCPDFNGDGSVQAQDLLDFLIAWGTIYQ
jgi:hypothetical protein